MQMSFECSTTASAVVKIALVGQTAWQGASVQCMQAIDTDRSPGLPSLSVTTRRRLMPHGTSCSFLQAVTQALHSVQRAASQRNFILAIAASLLCGPDLAKSGLRFLHPGYRIVAVGRERIYAFTQYDRIRAFWVFVTLVLAHEPASKVERTPRDSLGDAFCDERLHATRFPVWHFGG